MLTLQFDQNALKDKNRFELLITDENELSGLPESARDAAAMLAKSKDKNGWVIQSLGSELHSIYALFRQA